MRSVFHFARLSTHIIQIRFQNMSIPNAVFLCFSCFSWLKKKRHSPNFESDLVSGLNSLNAGRANREKNLRIHLSCVHMSPRQSAGKFVQGSGVCCNRLYCFPMSLKTPHFGIFPADSATPSRFCLLSVCLLWL